MNWKVVLLEVFVILPYLTLGVLAKAYAMSNKTPPKFYIKHLEPYAETLLLVTGFILGGIFFVGDVADSYYTLTEYFGYGIGVILGIVVFMILLIRGVVQSARICKKKFADAGFKPKYVLVVKTLTDMAWHCLGFTLVTNYILREISFFKHNVFWFLALKWLVIFPLVLWYTNDTSEYLSNEIESHLKLYD